MVEKVSEKYKIVKNSSTLQNKKKFKEKIKRNTGNKKRKIERDKRVWKIRDEE